jgi:cytochrome c-type biogenesis protein CcmH/NrfF
LSNIPSGWLLVLTIPLVLIVIGVLLEMRDRRKEREERKTSKLEWGDVEEPK